MGVIDEMKKLDLKTGHAFTRDNVNYFMMLEIVEDIKIIKHAMLKELIKLK